ncbi:hypothetical protein EDC01DRAFT_629610 [Geopyxis carbonaria]|nr:hypothetical protein EDC01DRAFT_629610 [Geopyxis carbonaria]
MSLRLILTFFLLLPSSPPPSFSALSRMSAIPSGSPSGSPPRPSPVTPPVAITPPPVPVSDKDPAATHRSLDGLLSGATRAVSPTTERLYERLLVSVLLSQA